MYAEAKEAETSVNNESPIASYVEKFKNTISIPAIKVTADALIKPVITPAPIPAKNRIAIETNSIYLENKIGIIKLL